MVLSSLGSLFSKKAGKTLAKEMLSSYIGLAIIAAALTEAFTAEVITYDKENKDEPPLMPASFWIWAQVIAVSVMSSLQQYFNISERLL